MPIRLPSNWRPPKDAQPTAAPEKQRKVRAPKGSREEPRADLVLTGELVPGVRWGRVHLWKCMGYTYISGCGVQTFRPGWKPSGKRGRKCPRCWGSQGEE